MPDLGIVIRDCTDYQILSRAVPLYQIRNKRTGRITFETLDHGEALEKASETDPYYP
jgi:hypothetical protein